MVSAAYEFRKNMFLKLCLFCRYVSGYKNRFQNFIRCLREMGDEVTFYTYVSMYAHVYLHYPENSKFRLDSFCALQS